MITNTMRQARRIVTNRFEYTPDSKLDKWKVHTGPGPIRGDCEDYALTILWILSDRSWFKFWKNLVLMRAVIWHARSYKGRGHAVLQYNGMFVDNMEAHWYHKGQMRHDLKFPWLAPLVALKMLMGRFT